MHFAKVRQGLMHFAKVRKNLMQFALVRKGSPGFDAFHKDSMGFERARWGLLRLDGDVGEGPNHHLMFFAI